jgi:hypothetical protein
VCRQIEPAWFFEDANGVREIVESEDGHRVDHLEPFSIALRIQPPGEAGLIPRDDYGSGDVLFGRPHASAGEVRGFDEPILVLSPPIHPFCPPLDLPKPEVRLPFPEPAFLAAPSKLVLDLFE